MIKNLFIWVPMILLACSAAGQSIRETKGYIYAITGVTVVDVEKGKLLRDQGLVVFDGRIAYVGPERGMKIPEGAERIDGRGKFLVPGFADMHVHLYTEGDAFTYLANGITTVRNMAGDKSHLEMKRRSAAGEIVGPRIVTAGPVIETRLSHPDNTLVATAAEARAEVERQRAAGYDFVKVYNDITPEIYKAVSEKARELGMAVVGHVPPAIGLRGALGGRQRSIEHLRGYIAELTPLAETGDSSVRFRDWTIAWGRIDGAKLPELAKATKAAGVWNCPTFTFTVHELSSSRVHEKLTARPETKWLSLAGMPADRTKGYLAAFSETDFDKAQVGLQNQFRLLRALDAAGAGLLVGTDSWLSGYAFADEMELMVKAGLSPARVLRAATLDSAKFFDEEKDRGSLREGQVADLVLLNADPLARIGNVRKISGVMKGGKYYSRAFLDREIGKLKESKARKGN